jgi:hypothetical protein
MEILLKVILWPFKVFAGIVRFALGLIFKALAAAILLLATAAAGGGVVGFFFLLAQAWKDWEANMLAGAFVSLVISGVGLWILEEMLAIRPNYSPFD